jgi:hypothetical protein
LLGDEFGENRPATLDMKAVEERVRFVRKDLIEPDDWTSWTITTF